MKLCLDGLYLHYSCVTHCFVWVWYFVCHSKETKHEDPSLMGCDTLMLGEWFTLFEKFMVPSFSRVKQSKTKCVWEMSA